ncbi:MAG: sugar transferase [Chlamydiae bacterium]|nr:sugar transferase [Chlamydiota bacterium]
MHSSNDLDLILTTFFTKSNQVRTQRIKRCFDIVFSLYVLILGSPVYLLIAILVKLSSSGPIFYSSQRVGAGGKMIRCWKFRTMFLDADRKLHALLDKNPLLKEEWRRHFKLKNDPRVTKIGAFLRKTSLDELPQFWNILCGDLSTVGPRPLSKEEVSIVIQKGYGRIFSIRPGLTGLWQTSGRSLIPFDQRLEIDMQYVHSQSLFFDLILIAKTIPSMILSKGAF